MNESVSSNSNSLIGLKIDDATLARLVEIARHHCKLVPEHGKIGTTEVRRHEIIEEIRGLRSARDALIRNI